MKISDMKNLGAVNGEKLNAVGIQSAEELRAIGTEKAYLRVKHLVDDGACLHFLYALEAAIQDIPKKELTEEKRGELRRIYQSEGER
ncbi:competence protein TfoX [Listeria newyorkensis]|uniref:Competence protein TfoX n=1 Tax=Listeria newyorkensis TaxID=1497681 RepID=A0ABX4XLC6_9LIST|nr:MULTISPECIES: TfoX/Sxy family DNA transformation protein [Listeria]KGL44934.1 competence protein TfoX [Listeriaceae bacterium FSL A5-0209]KGL40941.1 competence protein TfoX [Listeria newyorkensis]PNP89071.1 competence protein TfoX [Listeria newyorkensis]RQW68359.1 competence protein TfoX [Listeria sp. SHR_NRA_18]WAO21375.1 TfoX/Sxy family DNA transformation protein [Listeria newyorkensis]